MPDRRSTHQPVARFGLRVVAFGVAAALLSSCSSSATSNASRTANSEAESQRQNGSARRSVAPAELGESRLVVGSPEPGLQFTVSDVTGTVAGPNVAGPNVAVPTLLKVTSAADAATQFGQAVVDSQVDRAFALLAADERGRVGSALRFRELLAQEGPWQSVALVTPNAGAPDPTTSTGQPVALFVTREPGLDEIRGLVAASAVVQLPVVREDGSWRVRWERRQVAPNYGADEQRLRGDVMAWVADRQRSCGTVVPTSEFAGGLVGVVGLANSLCSTTARAVVAGVGDIYALDDPQPLLDSFGSASFDWARVVSLSAPTPMDVIAAPVGDRWLVVGVAPPRPPSA